MILKFGKYKGQDLKAVAKKDGNYVCWFLRNFNYKPEVYSLENKEEIWDIAQQNYRLGEI